MLYDDDAELRSFRDLMEGGIAKQRWSVCDTHFGTLTEAGYQPQIACFEVLHELRLIIDRRPTSPARASSPEVK